MHALYFQVSRPDVLTNNFTSEFAQAFFMRGKCYMYMGDHKRALYDFSAAILNETKNANKQPAQIGKSEGLSSYYSKCWKVSLTNVIFE